MSKKDSYWFRHDSTAGRALKMRKMAHIYGHWGKGVYWDVCEILRDQENYRFEKDEPSLQMLADLIGCKDSQKFISWYRDCVKYELLKEEKTYFISPALSESMTVWESKKSNGSKGGRPRKKPADSQDDTQDQKPNPKPNKNLTNNLIKTIIEQNITEQNIRDILIYWLEYRKSIKKPVTNRKTIDSLIKKFNDNKLIAEQVVNKSVENNYQGLFWDNVKPKVDNSKGDYYKYLNGQLEAPKYKEL